MGNDWKIKATGYYGGEEVTVEVSPRKGGLDIRPERYRKLIEWKVKRGYQLPGAAYAEEGSLEQVYGILHSYFFDGGVTDIDYEGEFRKPEEVPGRIY